MKNFFLIFILIPCWGFSQRIPSQPKILKVRYKKSEEIKILEKEKEVKKRSYRRRNIKYHTLGLGFGISSFLEDEKNINWLPNHINLAWRKKWKPSWHSLLSSNYSYIPSSENSEKVLPQNNIWSLECVGQYHIIPSNRIYYRRRNTAYLLAGFNLSYYTKPVLACVSGVGYIFKVNARWDMQMEQKFILLPQNILIGSFQITVSHLFPRRGLGCPRF